MVAFPLVPGDPQRYPMNRNTKLSIRTLCFATFVSAIGVAVCDHFNRSYVVVELPRPNSGTHSHAEASALLHERLAQTRGIPENHDVIQQWNNPYIGFRVHIDANGAITVTDPFEHRASGIEPIVNIDNRGTVTFNQAYSKSADGMQSIRDSRELTKSLLDGNPGGVLVTSETSGWAMPRERAIIDCLFDSSIQIFVVQ